MPDDYTPPTDGDFEPSSDWLTYMSTSNYPWFTDWLAAHDAELRGQIAGELLVRLPEILAVEASAEDGWLSDAQQCHPEVTKDGDAVLFCGDGSIDLSHIADYAQAIARGKE